MSCTYLKGAELMEEYTIYTYTVIRVPTDEFKEMAPYMMAILEDGNGERFMARVEGYVDGMDIQIGRKVTANEIGNKKIYTLSA